MAGSQAQKRRGGLCGHLSENLLVTRKLYQQ